MTWVPFLSKVFGHDGAFSAEPVELRPLGEVCVHDMLALKRLSVTPNNKFLIPKDIYLDVNCPCRIRSKNTLETVHTCRVYQIGQRIREAEDFWGRNHKESTSRLSAYEAILEWYFSAVKTGVA